MYCIMDNGRIRVSDRLRKLLDVGSEFILTTNEFVSGEEDRYICLYPKNCIERIRSETGSCLNYSICKMDKHNRVYIPKELREYAQIKNGSRVAILYIINGLEIWDAENYKKYLKRQDIGFKNTWLNFKSFKS